MSLFDPYSHTRLFELRQEQLARKARRRQEIHVDSSPELFDHQTIASVLQVLTSRITRGRKAQSAARPAGRPALDS